MLDDEDDRARSRSPMRSPPCPNRAALPVPTSIAQPTILAVLVPMSSTDELRFGSKSLTGIISL